MIPEERKAIARTGPFHNADRSRASGRWHRICEEYYPECCDFHMGLDAALALLVPHGWTGTLEPGAATHITTTYTIKEAP